MNEQTFENALRIFVENGQRIIDAQNYVCPRKLIIKNNKKYVKIIAEDGQRSVWAFVDKTNGNILKPAGWNAPAKHARGNIFNDNYLKTLTCYGPAYLR